jgi:cyclopropane fatty-acyl-phospholipid synthase-like methyltransferase
MAQHGAVDAYYAETWWDYRILWLDRRALAFHFGHHDRTTRSHADALNNANRRLADTARVAAGDRVLDAGCGVGGSSLWLARHRRAAVVGITCVGSQAARARRAARAQGDSPVFVQGDFMAMPLRDGSFDVVWALESLCHGRDKAAFYREASRLLRPNGRLVVAEYMLLAEPTGESNRRLVREWLDGWAMPGLASPERHRAWAGEAGLIDARVEDATARVAPSLRRLHRIAAFTYPLAWLAHVLRLRSHVQHGNVIAALRQYEALLRGLWIYGVLSASKPGGGAWGASGRSLTGDKRTR